MDTQRMDQSEAAPAGAPADSRAREESLRRRVGQLEEACEQAQGTVARYRELFEFAPDGYLVTDSSGNIVAANQAASALFGRPRQFLVGMPLPFLISREDRADFYLRIADLRRQPDVVQGFEARAPAAGGESRHLAFNATVVPGPAGDPVECRWLVRDVTEARRAEEELYQEKGFAEGLIETAEAIIVVAGARGQVLRVNAYLERLTGYSRDELLGREWWAALLAPPDRAAARAEFEECLAGRPVARSVRPLPTRPGGARAVAWSCKRLISIRREPAGVLLVGHDVTELAEAQERALRLERLAAIGQMAAGLSHESRNALQRGSACLERLRWALHGQPHALDLLDRARRAQDDLVRLYEDVREYAAPIRLDCRACDVLDVARQAWADALSVAPGRDARLEETAETDDPRCAADAFRLRQVFRIVFENALAACPDPVRVLLRCGPGHLEQRPALRVSVCDNGPGVDPEQRPHLFEPFHTTKVKGTGLGLAIARRIVEAHGGRIVVADRPPPGAEILITLPRRPP